MTCLYDMADRSPACDEDLATAMAIPGMRHTPVLGVEEHDRKAVSVMLTHTLVLVPDDTARHTKAVEKAIQVARLMGMEVRPFRAYLRQQATNPATVTAAPQAGSWPWRVNPHAHA